MSDRVTHPTNGPRHLYDTGRFNTLPAHLRVRPDMFVNAPRNGSPHVAADSKPVVLVDADPTRKVQTLPPHPPVPMPKVTGEPARRPVSLLHVTMWTAVVGVPVVAAVALVWSP